MSPEYTILDLDIRQTDDPIVHRAASIAITFDEASHTPVTATDVDTAMHELDPSKVSLVGVMQGQEVVAAALVSPHKVDRDGSFALVNAVAVASGKRNRGIGRVIMSAIAERAIQDGVEAVCLLPADENSERFYRRLGFTGLDDLTVEPQTLLDNCTR